MLLDTVNRSLVVVLGEAKASVDCDLTAGYADVTYQTYTDGSSDTTTNGTSQVTWVAAPAANNRRRIKQLTLYNNDTILHTVTVKYNDNGTLRVVWSGVVPPSQSLTYAGGLWNAGISAPAGPRGASGASGAQGVTSDAWGPATMTQPPAANTWTNVDDTSSAPTPVLEDFTSGGITGVRKRVSASGGTSTPHLYMSVRSRPGGAYDVIARFRIQKPTMSGLRNFYGLFFRESGTGKIHSYGVDPAAGISIISWSDTHTFVNFGGLDGTNSGQLDNPFDFWLKVHDDHAGTGSNGHLTYYASIDGNYWVQTSAARAYNSTALDFTSAPDQIGFGFDARDSQTATELVLELGSWSAQ